MSRRLNVRKLFAELGGIAATAEIVGVVRTQPYRWLRNGSMKVKDLDTILKARPDLKLDRFIEEESDRGRGSSK